MQTRNKYIFGGCPKLQINHNCNKNKIVMITNYWHEKHLFAICISNERFRRVLSRFKLLFYCKRIFVCINT